MLLEGPGLSWEYARRTCAACVDKLAGLQLSTPSNSFCQILLTLSCPLLSTDIFGAEENHVKFMYEEGYAYVYCWNLVLSVWALLMSSVLGLFCSLRRAYTPVLGKSLIRLLMFLVGMVGRHRGKAQWQPSRGSAQEPQSLLRTPGPRVL